MTVVSRTFVSVPERSAMDTWESIVALIVPDPHAPARREFAAVAGVACCCISDEALAEDPIVVYGVGPRLRIYAIYGDAAVEGDRTNESSLSWVPTDGDWRMSIPCLADDLEWVQGKLGKSSTHITARSIGAAVDEAEEEEGRAAVMPKESIPSVDLDAFFRR